MGQIKKVRDYIADSYGDNIVLFESPSFDSAIVGVTQDNRAVYDYDKMVKSLAQEYIEEGSDEEDAETMAVEWIEYNSLRALPYIENAPVVLFNIENKL